MTIEVKKDETPWEDPIVAEVRRAREALYAEAGYDLYELSRRLREEQALSGRPVVTHSSCRPHDTEVGVAT